MRLKTLVHLFATVGCWMLLLASCGPKSGPPEERTGYHAWNPETGKLTLSTFVKGVRTTSELGVTTEPPPPSRYMTCTIPPGTCSCVQGSTGTGCQWLLMNCKGTMTCGPISDTAFECHCSQLDTVDGPDGFLLAD